MRRVFVDKSAPQSDALQEAATRIRRGGLIAIPTDTLYGLAVNPFDASAVGRIFAVKGRAADRALPLIAADTEQILVSLGPLPSMGKQLAACFWPGPLTILIGASPALARDVTGGTGKVGVRVPADPIARAVCRAVGHPITATSANISGSPATASPDEVERTLGNCVDFLLDTGETAGGPPSTVVDVTGETAVEVRAGAIPWEAVLSCLQRV